MLSFPHLVVLFIFALIVFGPQKLPELARMLGKATAEFRKMTNDFRYALEDEVRELERQTRIREEEAAAASRATQPPALPAAAPPEGVVEHGAPAMQELGHVYPEATPEVAPNVEPEASSATAPETAPAEPQNAVPARDEKPSDDHTAV